MSNMTNKIKKELNRNLRYEEEMYTTVYGSIIICACIFNPSAFKVEDINKTWRKFMRGIITFPNFANEENKDTWMGDMLEIFGFEKDCLKNRPIAYVQGKHNCLFAPYVNETVLPLREDGYTCRTLEEGKVYPIDWSEDECKD